MKLLCKYQCCKLPLTNLSPLTKISKYNFIELEKQEKVLEFSELNDNTNTINPILESLSQNEEYETVLPDPSTCKRDSRIDIIAWKRQNRKSTKTDFSNKIYSEITGAQSISEIHQQLEVFKKRTQRITRKQSIMELVDRIGIASDNNENSN
eukprot:309751_1